MAVYVCVTPVVLAAVTRGTVLFWARDRKRNASEKWGYGNTYERRHNRWETYIWQLKTNWMQCTMWH